MNGAGTVTCARCNNGFTVSTTGTCIATPDGKCLDNSNTFTQNGYCNTCNYYSGFYAVRSLSSGTQLCSNGNGSEFNTVTSNTATRPDINNVIRQSTPGFARDVLGAVFGLVLVYGMSLGI